MSTVLEFLERVGQDWRLRHADHAVLSQALTQAGIAPALQSAVLDQDSHRLEALLQLSGNVCCAVHPTHEDDEEVDDDDDDGDLEDDDDFDDFEDDDEDDDDDDDEDEDDDEDYGDLDAEEDCGVSPVHAAPRPR